MQSGVKFYYLLICNFIVSKQSVSDSCDYIAMLRYGVTPDRFSYHLLSGVIFTPLIGALCIGFMRRRATQTPSRYESHSAPIAIRYSVTGA